MTASLRQAAQMAILAIRADDTTLLLQAANRLTAALALPDAEPVAWTLTETLDKRETTTTGYLWFKNPVNACWSPLYAAPQTTEPKTVERVPLTSEALFDLALTEVNRESDVVVLACNLVRAVEAAHNIKGAA